MKIKHYCFLSSFIVLHSYGQDVIVPSNNNLRFSTGSGEYVTSDRNGNFDLRFFTQYNQRMTITNSGAVGIGTATFDDSRTRLQVNGGSKFNTFVQIVDATPLYFGSNGNAVWINGDNTFTNKMHFFTQNLERMTIASNGTVGISNANPNINYRLDVAGSVHVDGRIDAKDICVSPTGFCDFVFDESYKLMSVDSLKNYISKNKHLPHFPSEKQIIKNGMSMTDITLSQTRTIEELVLYTIKQEEKLQVIENELVELKKLLNK